MTTTRSFIAISLALLSQVNAFAPPIPHSTTHPQHITLTNLSPIQTPCRQSTHLFNLLSDFANMMTNNGGVEAETELPYHPPFSEELSIGSVERTFAVRERAITFTGEDFDILDVSSGSGTDFVRVRGAMLHLPGKDKMRLSCSSSGTTHVTMDRVLIAATPSYDLYRHNPDGSTEKIGWIEKKLISFMDTFDVYMEGKGGFGVTGLFKPTPAYRIEGDFLDRNFSFKNEKGKIVARANMDGWIQLDMMNHYQVRVGEGMDALLVMACVCCIDEEFDEEHKKKREEREREQD